MAYKSPVYHVIPDVYKRQVLPGPSAFCVRRTQHRRQLHRIQLLRRVHHKRVNAAVSYTHLSGDMP